MGRWRRRAHRPGLALALPLLLTALAAPALGRLDTSVASAAAQAEGGGPTRTAEKSSADGRFLYLRDCAVCHGERGAGTPQGQSLKNIGPAEVDYTLSTGRMPVEKPDPERRRQPSRYSSSERAAIVDHMRPFIAAQPDIPHVDAESGDRAEGFEHYLALCAACHQWAGEGGALLGDIESPSLDKSTPLEVAEAIRSGPLNMPAFVLSDEEIDSIAAYVQYLKDPEDRGGSGLWHFGPLPEGAVAWVVGLGLVVLACRWIGTRE
jgi:ubiquinol-cytochrome c reductase cytochrome c subunit